MQKCETILCHTKKEENTFWKIDDIVDKVLAAEISNLTMAITGDTNLAFSFTLSSCLKKYLTKIQNNLKKQKLM